MMLKNILCFFIAALVMPVFAQGNTSNYQFNWLEPSAIKINDKDKQVLRFDVAEYVSTDNGLPTYTIHIPLVKYNSIEFTQEVYVPLAVFPFVRTEQNNISDTTGYFKTDTTFFVNSAGDTTGSTRTHFFHDTLFEHTLVSEFSAKIEEKNNVTITIDPTGNDNVIKIIPFRKKADGTYEKLVSFSIKTSQPTSSVFANQNLYKIKITESGVHKIDKKFLEKAGIPIASVDPRNIKIYGNGGGMLPQANAVERPFDLVETPIKVIGENDGVFDGGDYILFYGKGQHQPYFSSALQKMTHDKNIYSDEAYYFISISGGRGKRISAVGSEASFDQSFSYYDDYMYREDDLTNLILSGRDWVGDRFSSTNRTRSYSFSGPSLQPATQLEVISTLVSTPTQTTSFDVQVEALAPKNVSMPASTTETYGDKAREVRDVITINSSSVSGNVDVKYSYNIGSEGGNSAYLNRLQVYSKRRISLFGDQSFFRVNESQIYGVCEYRIGAYTGSMEVWDVSDVSYVKQQNVSISGSEGVFNAASNGVNSYLIFNASANLLSPEFTEIVLTQDLHGITNVPDMLIVAPQTLVSKAQEYANVRATQEPLSIRVVSVKDIFNEFSSGAQDITAIRDFARMLYARENGKLKYLLLFGDASYDYKNRVENNNNLIPTYQEYESYHNVNTYASDDYYGFMEATEGEWVLNHTLDIGVGRFPITTPEEADVLIAKVIQYKTQQASLGKWRNQITFMADDDDNTMHMDQANQLAEKIQKKYPNYNTAKIFLDAFEQIATPSGKVSPACAAKLEDKIETGSLIVNYTGHGSETQWTKEEVVNINKINKYRNFEKLALFVTATCEFGRYDDPLLQSGAERLLLNSKGGAIAMLTTTRPVYALSNFAINGVFYDKVFEPINDTLMPTLGQVIMATKNNSFSGTRNRNFTLLGDPSITLAYPKKKVVITEINGKSDQDANLRALGLATIKGEVRYLDNELASDFSGELTMTVFDKESQIKTLGDEGRPFDYKSRENILYEGKSTVKNGVFEVSFIIPKDISYQFDEGKISLYAKSYSADLLDAAGSNTEIIIGGTDSNAVLEYTPPIVQLYLDDKSFKNGGITDDSPLLIADITDENGINVSTAGLGHEMIAIIDGDESSSIVLNDFYSSNLDSYKSGQINYKYKDLEEGKHTLTVRAWDTHNNVGEATIQFEVSYSNASVHSYPNPMKDFTRFVIEHSREGEEIEVSFDIFTPEGIQAMHMQEVFANSDKVIEEFVWDATDEFGVKLQGGVYYYRMTIRYVEDNLVVTKVNKLVLIN